MSRVKQWQLITILPMLLVLLATMLPLAASPNGRKIAFVSTRNGHEEIYIMNSDGTQQKRLTHKADTYSPVFSPDGRKIAFTSPGADNSEIYIMNADGTQQKRLTNKAESYSPIFSPDGRKIAFISTRDGNPEIYIMNADGTQQKRLTHNKYQDSEITFSPDGHKIAFVSERERHEKYNFEEIYVIYIMNADGTHQKRLTNNKIGASSIDAFSPAFSPDGSTIAFRVSLGTYSNRIYLMNTDGTHLRRLSPDTIAANDAQPIFISDGRKLLFQANSYDDAHPASAISIMNINGMDRKRLTSATEHNNDDAAWNPDNHRIAFSRSSIGKHDAQIYIMNADGTQQKALTHSRGQNYSPVWQ